MQSVAIFTGHTLFFDQNEKSNFGLPKEIVLEIFKFLDLPSLAGIARSCKKLKRLADDAQLWHYLCIRDFFDIAPASENTDWKSEYEICHLLGEAQSAYPGKRTVFTVKHNWQVLLSTTPLVRKLYFVRESETEDSIFLKFSLYGYNDGSIGLLINFQESKLTLIKDYLKSLDCSQQLPNHFITNCCMYLIKEHFLMKKMFAILAKYHLLPKQQHDLAKKIIWAGSWTTVTLLGEENKEMEIAKTADNHTH